MGEGQEERRRKRRGEVASNWPGQLYVPFVKDPPNLFTIQSYPIKWNLEVQGVIMKNA